MRQMNVRRSSGATEGRSRSVARRTPSPSIPSSSAGSPSKTETAAARVPSRTLRHLVLSVAPGTCPRLSLTASQEVVPRFPPVQVAEVSSRAFSRAFFFFLNYFYAQRSRLRRPAFWDAIRCHFESTGGTGRGLRRWSGPRSELCSLTESSSTSRVLRPRENGSARRRGDGEPATPDC